MTTRVVNLRREPYDVYIGRAGNGKDGYFGNPFVLPLSNTPTLDRQRVMAQYREYFYARLEKDEEFRERVKRLRGYTLG